MFARHTRRDMGCALSAGGKGATGLVAWHHIHDGRRE